MVFRCHELFVRPNTMRLLAEGLCASRGYVWKVADESFSILVMKSEYMGIGPEESAWVIGFWVFFTPQGAPGRNCIAIVSHRKFVNN